MYARSLVLVVSAACATTLPVEQRETVAAVPTAATAAQSGEQARTIDEGTFSFLLGGKPAGEETFRVAAVGDGRELRTKSTLVRGDNAVVTETALSLDAAARVVGGEVTVVAGATTRRITLKRDGEHLIASSPGQADTSDAGDLFVMNGVVSHVGVACWLGGDADKEVSLFPGLTITLGAVQSEQLVVDGRGVDLRLVPISGAIAIDVYCDGQKPVLIDQGGAFTAIRDGYQGLLRLVARAPAKPDLPPEVEDLPRTVAVDGAKLACSLMTARAAGGAKAKRQPAIFFLSGSGPEDRDDDTVGPGGVKASLFRRIAVALARAGVATLRCDDRGVGQSTGTLAGSTLESYAADAVALAQALRKEPGVDPAHIGVIGHAEGGTIATLAAVRAKLRAVILLAAPGRPLDQLILEQSAYMLRQAGMPDDKVDKETGRGRRIYQAIREGKPYPEDTRPEEKKQFDAILPWLVGYLRHDPVAAAAKLTMPVLVAQGGKDFQVSRVDADALRRALARNTDLAFKLYPELSHVFAPVAKGTLADYSDPNLQVDPVFLADVAAFARKSLAAP